MNERQIVSSRGVDIEPAEFETVFVEEHVEHSTALHSERAATGTSYFVGPLARLNLNSGKALRRGTQRPRGPAASPGRAAIPSRASWRARSSWCTPTRRRWPSSRPTRSRRAAGWRFKVRAGEGCAATEAPRGLLYHRYRINDQGLVEFAKIVPPTAQNYRRMEDDLRLYAAGGARPAGGGDRTRLREPGSHLRSLHLLFDAFSEAEART